MGISQYRLVQSIYVPARRIKKAKETGKKPKGKQPKAPTAGPAPKDQVNLTDEESRIMPVAGGGFEQTYNAQAAVDTESKLIVTTTHNTAVQRQAGT